VGHRSKAERHGGEAPKVVGVALPKVGGLPATFSRPPPDSGDLPVAPNESADRSARRLRAQAIGWAGFTCAIRRTHTLVPPPAPGVPALDAESAMRTAGAAAKVDIRSAAPRSSSRSARSKLPAPAGFADASTLLARTYADQSSFYAATLKLATGTKTAAQGPYGTLNKMKKIETALQHFDIDLTACRRAFKEATASANLAHPTGLHG
jgi:hypothetical protein